MPALDLDQFSGEMVRIDVVAVYTSILALGEQILDHDAQRFAEEVVELLHSFGIRVKSHEEVLVVVARIMAEFNRSLSVETVERRHAATGLLDT